MRIKAPKTPQVLAMKDYYMNISSLYENFITIFIPDMEKKTHCTMTSTSDFEKEKRYFIFTIAVSLLQAINRY